MDEVLLIFFGISLDGNIGKLLFFVFGTVVDIISSIIVEGDFSFGSLIIVVSFGVIGLLYVWLFIIISVDWIGGWLNCVVVIWGIVFKSLFCMDEVLLIFFGISLDDNIVKL